MAAVLGSQGPVKLTESERNGLVEQHLGFLRTCVSKEYDRQKKFLTGLTKEDCFQECALDLLQRLAYYDPARGGVCTYIRLVVKNKFLVLTGQTPEVQLSPAQEKGLEKREAVEADPSERLEVQDALSKVQDLFRFLDARDREVLSALYGLDCEEVSAMELSRRMNLDEKRIRDIRDRALSKLRRLMVSVP